MAGVLYWKIKPLIIIITLSAVCLILMLQVTTHRTIYNNQNINIVQNDYIRNDAPVQTVRQIKVKERLKKVEYIVWPEPNGISDATGPGEKGVAVKTLPSEKSMVSDAYSKFGFNQFTSNKISLNRSLPDPRPTECQSEKLKLNLPKVSVIIIFHNEGWSTLLRTVYSVLNRSPPELLHEIVLCDDYSDKIFLKESLRKYVAKLNKVKLVRTQEREGLIRARTYGADHSTGGVILFLDSHCEANVGWLPPLLSAIEKDYRTVVCPTVDFIDHDSFYYRGVDPYIRGTFNWRFDYKERGITELQKQQRKSSTEGVRSPVMAGGLFAISRRFWEELGKYDPGMYVWGGEQYEISFKIWMCGGQMLNMPCSRVGHVYRKNVPYTYNKPFAPQINYKRVAEVWMDEFKEFIYQRLPHIRHHQEGDVTDRKLIRKRNKCKSFRWYLKNVANDTVRTRYEPDRGYGQIMNLVHKSCLDSTHASTGSKVKLTKCNLQHFKQKYRWTYINEFRQEPEECLDARFTDDGVLFHEKCHEMGGNQKFLYDEDTKQIRHGGTGRCLSILSSDTSNPILEQCSPNTKAQQWFIPLVKPYVPKWAAIAEDFPKREVP